jgi:hypothetical protein
MCIHHRVRYFSLILIDDISIHDYYHHLRNTFSVPLLKTIKLNEPKADY